MASDDPKKHGDKRPRFLLINLMSPTLQGQQNFLAEDRWHLTARQFLGHSWRGGESPWLTCDGLGREGTDGAADRWVSTLHYLLTQMSVWKPGSSISPEA